MKKHLFLLGSFMATSLVTANTLLVISCKKKAKSTKNDGKDDEKNTETVINKKSNELKDKIRNIIDDIITNTNEKDWLIDLKKEYENDYKNIISKLKAAVKTLRNNPNEKDQQMLFAEVEGLDEELISKVNNKFTSLKNLIMSKISESDIIDISNLEFDLIPESIIPILTNLSGDQVIEAIAVLKHQQESQESFSSNSMAKHLGYAATNTENFDLFKVKTNLRYNFKIAGKPFEGEYNDVELLFTGDAKTLEDKRQYTQDTIKKILTSYNDVKIYGDDDEKDWSLARESDYLGKKLDWDFSKIAVLNEIANLQFNRFTALKDYDKVIKQNLEIKLQNVDFDIDSSHYMKFNNQKMDLSRSGENNILLKQSSVDMNNDKNQIKNWQDASTSLDKQFFSDNELDLKKWNGGKINHEFMEQVKEDGKKKESDTGEKEPRINLDKYYGLGEKPDKDKYDSRKRKMLLGYGKTTIRGPKYAGIPLESIEINTDITASFDPGVNDLFANLRKYVGSIAEVLKETIQIGAADSDGYFFDWQFSGEGEWDAIKTEVTRPDGDGTVTFDWIMDKVLKDMHMLGDEEKKKLYSLPIDEKFIPKDAWSFLKTVNEIKYMQRDNDEYLMVHEDNAGSKGAGAAAFYVKYGLFVIHLVGGKEVWANFGGNLRRGVIGRKW